ncbi:MAG: DUF4350 domain-containing protein [Lentisphaeria bacterium]|nr:DUF4350 domain-containing protein [Lentisphaeria bacterium]
MKKVKPYIAPVLCVICLIVAAALVYAFLGARFSAGDTYPAYSSLRADPMGTRALFEALQDSSGLTAARALKPFRPQNASPHTRIYAGLDLRQASDWRSADIQGWVAVGGRLILAFNGDAPRFLPGYKETNDAKPRDENEPANAPDADSDDATCPDSHPVSDDRAGKEDDGAASASPRLMTWRQVLTDLGCRPAVSEKHEDLKPAKALLEEDAGLPVEVRWRSPLIFTVTGDQTDLMTGADNPVKPTPPRDVTKDPVPDSQIGAWTVIYKTFSGACVVEREIGKGKLIVMGESYLLSNEAMRKDRHAELLVWLIGDNRHVVFDETHFGLREQAGVGVLLRRYRLRGALLALALTGVLFVWRNSQSLVPSHREGAAAPALRVSQDGYLTLIQRGVSPKQLPVEWCAAWEQSRPRQSPDDERRITEAQAAARTYDPKKPLDVFDKISRILTDKPTSSQP